jgi:hypothetical protein
MLNEKSKKIVVDNLPYLAVRVYEEAVENCFLSKIFITGFEKWNYGKFVNGEWVDSPDPINGIYDVEGHSWTDICAFFKLNLFKTRDLKIFLKQTVELMTDIFYLWFFKTKKVTPWLPKFWKDNFKTTINLIKNANLMQKDWVWTIEALSVFKSDIIEIKISEMSLPDGECIYKVQWDDKKRYIEYWKEIEKGITRAELLKQLNEKYIQLNEYLWVSKNDSTSIIVDDTLYPFDMKDGFSNKQITKILEVWFLEVFGNQVLLIESDEKAYSNLSRNFIVSDLDIKRGDIYTSEEVFDKLKNNGKI